MQWDQMENMMTKMLLLREAVNVSLVCGGGIWNGRHHHHRLATCDLGSSGTILPPFATLVTNFSSAHGLKSPSMLLRKCVQNLGLGGFRVHGLKRTSFLRKSVQGWGSGFRVPNPCRALSMRRMLHSSTVLCSSDAGAEQPDKSRGGLPRFHVDRLPALEGMVARVEGDEFSHMTKVLRLKVEDKVELFDGRGGIVNGQLSSISRTAAEVITLENLYTLSPVGPHWHVAAAFCTLKGGRGEWLVEKCTELGARTLTPLLTQRSSSVSGGRTDRWQRIALAATKQCQRLHNLDIEEPTSLPSFLPQVSRAEVAFVATAGAPPLYELMSRAPSPLRSGILFIGPEGDFTPDELNSLVSIGATPVGLGPRRLRVETATVAMLAAVMLMVETGAGNLSE